MRYRIEWWDESVFHPGRGTWDWDGDWYFWTLRGAAKVAARKAAHKDVIAPFRVIRCKDEREMLRVYKPFSHNDYPIRLPRQWLHEGSREAREKWREQRLAKHSIDGPAIPEHYPRELLSLWADEVYGQEWNGTEGIANRIALRYFRRRIG